MSGAATGWAKRQTTGDPLTKLLLLVLADYAQPGSDVHEGPAEADGRHFSWCGVDTLVRETECSKRTVVRHLKALKEAGFIVRERRMRGLTRTSDYTILACDGVGDRPFTAEEQLIAEALSSDDVSLASTGLACEEVAVTPSEEVAVASSRRRLPEPPKTPSGASTEEATPGAYVPYTGTTSNYEPKVEPPVGGGREVALIERDDLSPGFLTTSSGDVLSSHTPSVTAEFSRQVKATTEEIMTGWQTWIGRTLPSIVVVEVGKIVKRCVADGVDPDAIKLGLGEWTEAGMIAPKYRLEPAIAGAVTRRLKREPTGRPSGAQKIQQVANQAAALVGKTADDLDDALEAMMRQSRAAGFGGEAAVRAISGGLA